MKEIAAALFKFQQEVGKVSKDATNPYFKSKYATLSNVLDVIKKPLEKCNLVIVQSVDFKVFNEIESPLLKTSIIHVESGEKETSFYPLTPVKLDPQGIGSAITYARRYSIVSMLCLDVDDDDDGNAATKVPVEQVQVAIKPKETTDVCKECGGPMVLSKAGKPYCKAVCWKRTNPVIHNQDDIPDPIESFS